jgi:hypothetical protein
MSSVKEALEKKGMESSFVEERMRNRSTSRSLMDIKRRKNRGEMEDEGDEGENGVKERIREASRSRSKGYVRKMTR